MHTVVHIGWPKTATSWLQEQVFVERLGYQQIMSREDVIRLLVLPDQLAFESERLRSDMKVRAAGAWQHGRVPVVSHERLCGVLRNRLESVVLGERVLSVLADPRVIIVVREQNGAMLAAWQQYVRDGGAPGTGPSIRSLRSYYGDHATRGSTLPPIGDLRYFEYDRLVRWYVERLGADRVDVLPLEALRRDPGAFYDRVRRFCGVVSSAVPDFGASNEAWAPLTYAVKRRLNYVGDRSSYTASTRSRYQQVMRASYRLDRALPGPVRTWGAQRAREIVSELAGTHFAPSNRRLQELVDWDLRDHGYLV